MSTRSLHLIDLENLAGFGLDPEAARHGLDAHLARFWHPGDIVVIASCRSLFAAVGFGLADLPHRYRLVRPTTDAADLELLRAGREADLSGFSHLAIASGDGIFTELAGLYSGAGHTVSVSARRGTLARRLRLAATQVHIIDRRDQPVSVRPVTAVASA